MALTITRPIGRRFGAPEKTATVDNNFNYARFTSTAHGLTTGDFLVIENSPIPAYNGIWYADVNDANEYFIRPAAGVDFVLWVADATVTVRGQDLEHMWSAVHLPIVYEVTTTLFPFSTTTALGIVSIDNNNGYARLRLTGDFSASSDVLYPLEFIRVTNAADSRLNGIWQIQDITYAGGQAYVTIDLAYLGTYNQASSQVRRYYSNYALIVRVYAGITGALAAKKPVELAATLKFIPDNNNTVRFSISEVLKSYVKLRNGVGDDTMPVQIDLFTDFYVTYQETYDYSFGYTLLRSEGSITTDTPDYVGHAVNAKLLFGNIYSGYLSDYLMNISTAKFLTLFSIPTLFSCQDYDTQCYHDVSFISETGGGVMQKQYYKSGVLQTTVTDTIPDKGPGVYRVPIKTVNDCLYDEVAITLTDDIELDVDTFQNFGSGTSWTTGPTVTLPTFLGLPVSSKFAGIDFFVKSGTSFQFEVSVSISGLSAPGSVDITVQCLRANGTIITGPTNFSTYNTSSNGTAITGATLTPTEDVYYLSVQILVTYGDGGSHSTTIDWNYLDVNSFPVSERKTFKIDCGCSAQQIKLTWINNLGGFEYWTFKAEKDYMTEVTETQTSEKNILPSWPQSYGHTADTLRYETLRVSRRQIIVRSQNGLTVDEAFAISYIKSSPLVQIIDEAGRRTVTVDTNSLRITGDGDKLREIEFTITETGDIPAQTA
jgi:hypothetical protein